jgi:hypothetical protein
MNPLSRLLDRLLGPREWCVIINKGAPWATPISLAHPTDTILRAGLRQGAASRLARRLRLRREDTPERIG